MDPLTSLSTLTRKFQTPFRSVISRGSAWIVLAAIALLVSALLLIPQQAQAQTPQLVCAGSGIARTHVSGSLAVGSTGGAIRVYDADSIDAQGVGDKFDYGNWTHFIGWIGQIGIGGTDFNVRIVASNVSFVATGQGMTWVRGVGTCTTSTGATFSWTDDLQAIVIQ